MTGPKPQSVSLVSSDRRLQVEFNWHHDRFAQRLILDGVEAGCSVEGDAENPWPPSPPLQQLSCQQIEGNDVILGVGAAGKGHWSISVEVAPEAGASWLKFDLALRSNHPPAFLGSTYRLSDAIIVMTSANLHSRLEILRSGPRDTVAAVRADPGVDSTHCWSYYLGPKTL